MACNSVTSVSLDPPLISFCLARTSETWPALRSAGHFCINFMAEHHEDLIHRFASKTGDRFADVHHHARQSGPALDDAVAWLDCELRAEHEAGDHFIVLAEVVALDAEPDAAPIIFFRGHYGAFAPGGGTHREPVDPRMRTTASGRGHVPRSTNVNLPQMRSDSHSR